MYSILETTVYFVVLPAQHMFPTFQGLYKGSKLDSTAACLRTKTYLALCPRPTS